MTNNRTKIMLATLAVIAIISTVVVSSMETSESQAYGQTAPVIPASRERTISVTGSATTSIAPDLVMLQFGVDTEAKTAQDAISANSNAMNSIVAAVTSVGVTKDEVSTASFSIYPIYNDTVPDPKTGIHQSVLAGYRTSNTLFVKTANLSLAGKIIDSAVGAGANRVDSVSFSLSPAKQQSTQDDLLGKAVLNAKSKAGKALDPLGQKIIGVKMVNLSEGGIPSPLPYYKMDAAGASLSETPIFSSNQDVTTTANVTFLIGDQ